MKILIVDDAPNVLKILDTTLSLEDHEVTKANNAEEAMLKVKTDKFDIGIFDVNMPGKTGIELTKDILQTENGKDMKIIMLTTESSDELKKKGKEAGAKAWIIKPFQNEDLLTIISKLAGK